MRGATGKRYLLQHIHQPDPTNTNPTNTNPTNTNPTNTSPGSQTPPTTSPVYQHVAALPALMDPTVVKPRTIVVRPAASALPTCAGGRAASLAPEPRTRAPAPKSRVR